MSHKSVSKRRKSYPPEFREKTVNLITELGYSVSEVAQQLGCSKSSFGGGGSSLERILVAA